jgi:hypothetical protein
MFLGSGAQLVRRVHNLTGICELTVLDNVGSSTSHNPIGLHGLLRDSFTYFSLLEMLCQFLYAASDQVTLPGTPKANSK